MGNPGFAVEHHGKSYSAVALSAIVLQHLTAEVAGASSPSAVITTPAYFDNNMREDTLLAGRQAGINVLGIINEPTAAAIAFGTDRTHAEKTVLVYDLGGGTFDVTIVQISPDGITVLGSDGDHQLGGKNWDDRLVRIIADKFHEEHGENPLEDPLGCLDLTVRCETAKLQLSTRDKARVAVTYAGLRGSYEVSRSDFESASQDLTARTLLLTNQALADVGKNWQNVQEIVCVGGSTRMPMVRSALQTEFRGHFATGVNPDEAVALGAALEASRRTIPSGKIHCLGGPMAVTDVMAHSLGMVAEKQDRSAFINSIILPKNQKIPSHQVRPFQQRTRRSGTNATDVYVLQGESENPLHCSLLGKYVISGIDPEPGGTAVLDIGYRYDQNGVVQVEATQRSSGKKLPVSVDRSPADMDWLHKSPTELTTTAPTHLSIFIAVDLSGSMSGEPLEKAKEAARNFIHHLDLSTSSVGLHIFADENRTVAPLTQSAKDLERGIQSWKIPDVGYGNAAHPFDALGAQLADIDGNRYVLLLTDGVWSHASAAISAADRLKAAGVQIVSMGFGGADQEFLTSIANSEESALLTDMGQITEQFGRIAQVMTESQACHLPGGTTDQRQIRFFG
ncbi:Hsp70 family protein [Verrucomicrobium sp. BvORR034]|uniref:Hsp70 family protein n=1 Tax=Verrucomicrobium sp. BvORR034 TaxID=1396418 RepID=UPI000679B612|nr:Hsp70 family protein [Verrucomicrobium sp. BvORR034]